MVAIYWHPDGYDTVGAKTLLGRHSAGEGFLRGYLRHGSAAEAVLWNVADQEQAAAEAIVRRIEPTDKPLRWIGRRDLGGLARAGVANLPVPGLGRDAWARRMLGDQAYSLCGVTHTVASHRVLDILAEFPVAPVQPWDALVCTSRAALAALNSAAEHLTDYLRERMDARRLTWPQYHHIPLGVDGARFTASDTARTAWRTELAIPDEAVVILYFGRFNALHKAHPAPMALAVERAASRASRPVHWVLCGKVEGEGDPFESAVRVHCDRTQLHFVDGRRDDATAIWSAADLFISFSDNIQETFGMTPVEAMAAGLPSVVSDWDGYKDGVRHGVDGFRIPTITPAAGLGRDLALAYGQEWINYGTYVGAVAQFTAVDLDAAARALLELIENPELRRRMGAAARRRALEVFDWGRIIPQYEALWAELDARRRAAPAEAPRSRNAADNPWRPDPFRMFASYPTEWATSTTLLAAAPGMDQAAVEALTAKPLVRLMPQYLPTPDEVRAIVEALAAAPQTALGDLLLRFPAGRRPFLERGVVWMAKYGLLVILSRSNHLPG